MLSLRPIVIDEDNVVLGGNMRLQGLKKLGYKEIPDEWVQVAHGLTEAQKKEFIIKDNVGFGEWDWDMLQADWDLQELEDWGMDIPEFDEDIELEAQEDDYTEPEQMQVDVVEGDLIEFVCEDGRVHRLLCGDSTNSDDVEKLMQGEKADLAHNDPPYGMKKESDGVLNDNLNFNDLLQFNKDWVSLQVSHMKENGSIYIWGIDEPLMDIYSHILKPYVKEQKATFRNLITWDKGSGQGQNLDSARMYALADEKCLFFMLGIQTFNDSLDNYLEDFEIIRAYLNNEKDKMKWTSKHVIDIIGKSSASHYFSKSQWFIPTEEHYKKIQKAAEGNAFKKPFEEIKKEYEKIKKEYNSARSYFNNTHDNQNNVWRFDRTSQKERTLTGGHATPKPLLLCERVIKSSCPPGGLTVDFFLGSGSTMVAAHQLKYICYGLEFQPKYCQVIIDRMQKLDDTIKVKINGKDYVQN